MSTELWVSILSIVAAILGILKGWLEKRKANQLAGVVDVVTDGVERAKTEPVKEVIEKKQERLIAAGLEVTEEDKGSLKPRDPEYMQFAGPEGFGGVLETESDLKPMGMTLDFILDLAGKEADNRLAARDLGLLEPFFEEVKA